MKGTSIRTRAGLALSALRGGVVHAGEVAAAAGRARLRGFVTGFRAYEAGQTGSRLDPDFNPAGYGPNALAEGADGGTLQRVRDRSRALHDSNELVDAAAETLADNIVGTGIDDCEPDTGWEDLDTQIRELWAWAVRRVDPERCMSLGESQRLFVRELAQVGECGVHVPIVPAMGNDGTGAGWPAMPALDLIDADRVGLDLSGTFGGNEVRQGVEYDAANRVVAYHVYRRHPRDGGFGGFGGLGGMAGGGGMMGAFGGFFFGAGALGTSAVVRIPADRMELAFISRRVEQLRGVPRLMSAMRTVRTEEGYVGSTMALAELVANIGLIFEGQPGQFMPGSEHGDGAEPGLVDAFGRPILRTEAAGVMFMRPGSKPPTPVATTNPGPQFDSTDTRLQRRMARGVGLPYSGFAGDSSQSTFSSMRGENLDARKGFRPLQRFVWEHHSDPWRRRLIEWAVFTGRITLTPEQALAFRDTIARERVFRCTPGYPGWDYVNPAQESNAAKTDIESGVRSRIAVHQERGGNWRATIAEEVKYEVAMREARIAAGLPPEKPAPAAAAAGAAPAEKPGEKPGDDGGDEGDERKTKKREGSGR